MSEISYSTDEYMVIHRNNPATGQPFCGAKTGSSGDSAGTADLIEHYGASLCVPCDMAVLRSTDPWEDC